MHTEALAGKPGVSLQAMLPEIIGEACHASLLNRLDFPTSGLATAALDELGERQYRDAQETRTHGEALSGAAGRRA